MFSVAGAALRADTSEGGPKGIYVFPTPAMVKNGSYERALSVSGIDGVAVVFDWSELSPSGKPKTYEFTELDQRMAMAREHHLRVELVIEAGKGVPEWLYPPPPAGLGAKRLDFVYAHHSGRGAAAPKKLAMPPPWDPVYQDAFADMLNQVATHLRATGAAQDLAVIKLTGLNTESEELRLPAQTPDETGRPESTDSVAIWRNAGYRPSLIEKSFRGLATSFARAFPDTAVALPLIFGNAFPPIDERGQVLSRGRGHRLNAEMLVALVPMAAKIFPGRFIVQHDFLIADQPAAPEAVELARTNNLPIAWQTNLYLGGQGKAAAAGGRFGDAIPCDEASFLKLLQNGIYPEGGTGLCAKARYIEVFPSDVIAFPEAIAAAHNALAR
jgi:hypothetical protein